MVYIYVRRGALLTMAIGHWIQVCPTNMDPSMDKRPPPKYRCEICKAKGDHFATLCPQNKMDISLTQLRRKARIASVSPSRQLVGEHRHGHHYEDFSDEDSRSRTRSRTRSRSPYRETHRAREYDSYRPRQRRQARFSSPMEKKRSGLDAGRDFEFDKEIPAKARGHLGYGGPARRIKHQEGRLSFHDDIYNDLSAVQDEREAVIEGGPMDIESVHGESILEDDEKVTRDVHAFLQGLAADDVLEETITSDDRDSSQDDDCISMANDDSPPEGTPTVFQASDGFYYRRVSPPHFTPEVVSMFRGKFDRLAKKPSRTTALQMMDET